MSISLDAISTLDRALIVCLAILGFTSINLALGLHQTQKNDPEPLLKTSDENENSRDQGAEVEQKKELEQLHKQLKLSQEHINTIETQLNLSKNQSEESSAKSELTLLQLYKVQEELEKAFQDDKAKQLRIKDLKNLTENSEKQLDEARSQFQASQAQLKAAEDQFQASQAQCVQYSEEAELILLQLHAAQEELEKIFLQDQSKQSQINELEEKLEKISLQDKSKQSRIKDLKEKIETYKDKSDRAESEMKSAKNKQSQSSKEAELMLLQLQQVQEELEHYFLLSKEQASLLDAHADQQKRFEKLLNKAQTFRK